jgi:hypothetical protein
MYKKTDLAYFAGIMDGEGWFSIQKSKRKIETRSQSYMPTIGVANTDLRLIQWLIDHYGGKYYTTPPTFTQMGAKDRHQWRPLWKEIKGVIKQTLPFLVLKQERAKLLLELGELSSAKFRKIGVPPENLAKRESIYLKLKELNGYKQHLTSRRD